MTKLEKLNDKPTHPHYINKLTKLQLIIYNLELVQFAYIEGQESCAKRYSLQKSPLKSSQFIIQSYFFVWIIDLLQISLPRLNILGLIYMIHFMPTIFQVEFTIIKFLIKFLGLFDLLVSFIDMIRMLLQLMYFHVKKWVYKWSQPFSWHDHFWN